MIDNETRLNGGKPEIEIDLGIDGAFQLEKLRKGPRLLHYARDIAVG